MPGMGLLKTSFFTAISTSIRLVALFLINKVIAVFIGPAGLALTGQFLNFVTFSSTFSNGGINNGIVKYVAEKGGEPPELRRILSSALFISLTFSSVISLLVIFFRAQLSLLLLGVEDYQVAFLVLGFSLFFIALYNCLISVVNGFKDVKSYVYINIISSLLGLVCVSAFIYFYKLTGSLVAVSLSQALSLIGAIYFVRKTSWFRWSTIKFRPDPDRVKLLLKYSAMTTVGAITLPLSQICVRSFIAQELDMQSAGLWEGVWRISEAYLMLITASLSVYYLPKLSEIHEREELRKEIFSGYKIIMPIVIIVAVMIYCVRIQIIDILFTPEFRVMEHLFAFQLIGDVVKIGSWLLAFIMLAKAMAKIFIITEIIFSTSFVLLSIVMIKNFGLVGATMAFSLNYFIYFLVMLYFFRGIIFNYKT